MGDASRDLNMVKTYLNTKLLQIDNEIFFSNINTIIKKKHEIKHKELFFNCYLLIKNDINILTKIILLQNYINNFTKITS